MKRELYSLFATVFLLAFGMSFVSPLIPLLLKSIGASSASIGHIQTTYFLSFTITTTLLGRWIERAGSKKIILCGLCIFGSAVLAMPYMPSYLPFYIIRIVQGVGSALLFAPTEAAINIISPPERRGANMGMYGVVFAAGFAVGPGIGSSLYAINPSAPFIFGSLSCYAAAVVLAFGFSNVQVPVKKTDWGFLKIISNMKIPLGAAACYAVVEVAFGSFLALYLDALEIRGASLGIVFTFFAIGGALSPYPAGKIADRLSKRTVLKLCGILLACATFSFNFFTSYWIICLLSFSIGVVAGALYPVSLALIGEIVPPEKMGTANASFSFFYGLGSIAGPLATGWVLELFSVNQLFYPMTFSAFLFVIITFLERPGADSC